MTVLIDLEAYLSEVEAFSALAAPFVDRASTLQLDHILRELRQGISRGEKQWHWQTRGPISFGPSTLYDGPEREHPEAWFDLSFTCSFDRTIKKGAVKRGCTVWELETSATHVIVRRADPPALHIHFDYKNPGQWGPQMHVQVSEHDIGGLPIPRIFASAFLPTDCADLMLAELHPEGWERLQHEQRSSTHVSIVRDAQQHRLETYVRDIAAKWRGSRQSTRICMLQAYTAGVSSLPDFRGNPAVAGWTT